MDFEFSYNGKRLSLDVKRLGKFSRGIGLMFKSSPKILLFDFGREVNLSIHSYFVFFPFLAFWLDDKNRVLDWKIVRPFESGIRPHVHYRRLVEVPLTE